MNKVRKIFSVIIGNKEYDVFDIEGKEHEGLNGEPKTWWIYYADKMPEKIMPPIDSDSWRPWSKSINRRLWDIRFKEYNSSKEKWGETNFRHGLTCEMYCNNRLIYSFGTHTIGFAFAKCQYLMTALSEHSYNFFEPELNKGQKIYFYGLPATVLPKSNGWEIEIVPEYTVGINEDEWWKEFKVRRNPVVTRNQNKQQLQEDDDLVWGDDERSSSGSINWGDAFNDRNIEWHRSLKENKI